MLMKLDVKFLEEPESTDTIETTLESDGLEPTDEIEWKDDTGSADDSRQRALSSFIMTPQFCLRYSTGDSPHLSSIEPWEVPFFDLSLVRTWFQGCEDVHGSQCVGNGHPQISEWLVTFRATQNDVLMAS
jgi:hypothetical protein